MLSHCTLGLGRSEINFPAFRCRKRKMTNWKPRQKRCVCGNEAASIGGNRLIEEHCVCVCLGADAIVRHCPRASSIRYGSRSHARMHASPPPLFVSKGNISARERHSLRTERASTRQRASLSLGKGLDVLTLGACARHVTLVVFAQMSHDAGTHHVFMKNTVFKFP